MTYASEVLADSPILYWKVNETSGTAAADASGNSRAGTYLSTPTLGGTSLIPTDGAGKSFAVNGAGQSAFRTSESALNPTACTAECWFKITGSPGANGYHAIMAKDHYTQPNNVRGWTVVVQHSTGIVYFFGRRGDGVLFQAESAASAIVSGTTYHVAATYDGTTARLYLNGVEIDDHAPGGSSSLYGSSWALQIGKDSSGSARSMNGVLDDFALYGSALSGARILAHYDAGVGNVAIAGSHISETTTVRSGAVVQGITIAGAHVTETTTVHTGVANVGALVVGAHVVETTTVRTGTVVEGLVRAGSHVTEATTVNSGVVTVGVVVGGSHVTETTTVNGGTTLLPTWVVGTHVTETTTVFTGDVVEATGTTIPGTHLAEITTVRTATVVFGYGVTSRDLTSGRLRGGVGYASWNPAVVPTPPLIAAETRDIKDKALAFTPVTIVGTQPTFDVTEAATPRHRDRILVGGRDVTYFRGAEVRVGSYQLIEPFAYGTATLEFPQVYPEYEEIGAGDLDWLKPGKKVRIQRVDATGNVVATDYKGVLIAPSANTGTFTFEVGGEVTGPAALRFRPMPLFRSTGDIGRYLSQALGFVGVRSTPRLGTETGIETTRMGGMPLLDYMQALVSRGWTRDGNQWTVMPNDDGVYEVRRKNRTSIDGTVYLSATSAQADLRRDIAEEPNRIFATGVTDAGKRVRFGRYPGLDIQDEGAPAFPGFMTEGDTGDDVLTLISQLRVQNYLNAETAPGGYDQDVTKAIRAVQEDAEITVTGNVNETTWEAIFDNVSQGVSLKLARIEPAAQRSYTKPYRYSASGAIIGRNPNYDPTRLKIDREIDFGTGFSQGQMREWSKTEIVEGADPNWVGTLTIHSGAVVAGEHTPGDPITEILAARDIKAGMNLSLPQFQGGIVVHVTAASVSNDVVTLQVDTRARDAWTVAQVIERNRETRRDPERAFFRRLGSSKVPKDAVEEWSEVGGLITKQVLSEGWNVIEVVAGQSGTVRSIRLETNPNAQSVIAVFGKKVWPKAMQRLIGNPLTEDGSAKWSQENIRRQLERDHGLLYSAGNQLEPGGYSPGTLGEDGTGILTGKFEDDASFPYYTEYRPILYVAVWVDRDCVIPGGRILWPNMEPQ